MPYYNGIQRKCQFILDSRRKKIFRVHIDYTGPFRNKFILIFIDVKSRWIEARITKKAPTSQVTTLLLDDIFSTHGYSHILVSNNATIFTGNEFVTFREARDIQQKFIAPGHPATNGLAEKIVQLIKRKLKALPENESMQSQLKEILLRYYAAPLASGKTPAELYLHRKIRTKLDAIRPVIKEKPSITSIPLKKSRQLNVGDCVQAKYYPPNSKPTWKFGTIVEKYGLLHYGIKLDDGFEFKRHINQLLKSAIQRKTTNETPQRKVTFEPSTERPKPLTSSNWYIFIKKIGDNVIFQ